MSPALRSPWSSCSDATAQKQPPIRSNIAPGMISSARGRELGVTGAAASDTIHTRCAGVSRRCRISICR